MNTPTLQTERLMITPFVAEDADALYAYRIEPSVQKYQDWEPQAVADSAEFIQSVQNSVFNTPDSWYQLAIRLKNSNQLIGDLGVHFLDVESRQVEIGYTVAPAHQRQGYASEAIHALITFLFNTLDKHRITASLNPDNVASIALLQKIGMRHEAHFRQSIWHKGEWVDDVIFAVLQSEWNESS